MWQRQQQMITRFPKNWKILYVEPSFWLAIAWSIINKTPFRNLTYKPRENISVISIPTIPFGDKFQTLRSLNDKIITNKMKKILKHYKIENPALMFYKPRFSCVVGNLNESSICYDITDDIREFDASPKWLDEHIKVLESKSDLIFTSSEKIYKKFQDIKKENVFLIGNGVDCKHFEKSFSNDTKIAEDIQNIPSPIIGYVGAIGEWFDFELLQKILKKYPKSSIVLVGWVFGKQKKILKQLKFKNLYVLGIKKYQELPKYIKAFDVCIIPFLVNNLTQSVNPNKFYEYLASGKPIVTSSIPELEKFKNVAHIAKNHEEFLQLIETASKEKYNIENALQVAKENDWSDKADKMVGLIRKFCLKI